MLLVTGLEVLHMEKHQRTETVDWQCAIREPDAAASLHYCCFEKIGLYKFCHYLLLPINFILLF